jgi:RimJ/RimL family protein N-acetyltransferase
MIGGIAFDGRSINARVRGPANQRKFKRRGFTHRLAMIQGIFMNNVLIEAKRIVLKTFTPADADELFAGITPAITRFMTWEPPASPATFAEVWQSWLTSIQEGTEQYLVVRLRANGCCLGLAGLHAMRTKCPELGIWLRADSHGRGFGREAIEAVARWASQQLALDYFEYPVAEQDLASRRIAESLGGVVAEHRTRSKYDSVVYHIPRLTNER